MRNAQRAGFTLIELMVAMALTLFLMVILTQAFVTSLETFSGMKGIGDMQVNLRTAANILRNDLSQYHFDGARRLSDVSAAGNPLIVRQPPQAGFFAVMQGSAPVPAASATSATPYVNEGSDTSGPSYRAVDHVLYMTVTRRGNRQENFFTTPVQGAPASFFNAATAYDIPGTQLPYYTWVQPGSQFYSSQWAEVVYFLKQTGSTEEPNNPNSAIGTPTFGLYRAQFVMVPDSTNVNTLGIVSAASQTTIFAQMSTSPSLLFNSPSDAATIPGRRVIPILTPAIFQGLIGLPGAAPGDARFQTSDANGATAEYAANLVLPNVLSFHVQIMLTNNPGFVDVPTGVFDTTNLGAASPGLKGVQITLRVFDNASRQARQITIVQDL